MRVLAFLPEEVAALLVLLTSDVALVLVLDDSEDDDDDDVAATLLAVELEATLELAVEAVALAELLDELLDPDEVPPQAASRLTTATLALPKVPRRNTRRAIPGLSVPGSRTDMNDLLPTWNYLLNVASIA